MLLPQAIASKNHQTFSVNASYALWKQWFAVKMYGVNSDADAPKAARGFDTGMTVYCCVVAFLMLAMLGMAVFASFATFASFTSLGPLGNGPTKGNPARER